MKDRLIWVDQAKGLGIFLVIYGHNNPFLETYIYAFHMPLFFFISGMFHPNGVKKQNIVNRAKSILIPYFIWAFFLYIFWFFLGRNYGNSLNYNLDPLDGFIGVFYAQGGILFMDWGVPMWFLPCVFLTFVLYSLVKKIKSKQLSYVVLICLIAFGFIFPRLFSFKLPWSIDVACVSLIFYASGSILKEKFISLSKRQLKAYLIVFAVLFFAFVCFNIKIDMYRSIYGNELFFILNGLTGSILTLLVFRNFKLPKFFTYLGQNTIPLLALHFRALTVIKVFLIVLGYTVFVFNEPIKLLLSIVQVLLIIPIIYFVNRYLPLLNGKHKK